ncbi:MAG: hypothetical protein HFE61_00625 [Anaerotignum sp.]|jgi:metal-responsive CopG/Arc/MetJ family transcriptional regulator|nr:hypothetical protein [Anaerotignum sp.]MCI8866637.1 hypothetical protein [Anaerotignum sp.]
MATDRPRYTISVTNEMFQAIEDFRFKNRYQTRSEATAELIRLGLEQLKKETANNPNEPEHMLPIAAHELKGSSKKAIKNDDDIMKDDKF